MDLARMELNEAAARRAGDHRTADYWHECVEVRRFHDRLDEWDTLKGSPDTSRLGNGSQ